MINFNQLLSDNDVVIDTIIRINEGVIFLQKRGAIQIDDLCNLIQRHQIHITNLNILKDIIENENDNIIGIMIDALENSGISETTGSGHSLNYDRRANQIKLNVNHRVRYSINLSNYFDYTISMTYTAPNAKARYSFTAMDGDLSRFLNWFYAIYNSRYNMNIEGIIYCATQWGLVYNLI